MKNISRENNFIYLCIALIVLLFSGAVIEEFPDTWGDTLFSIVTIVMLLVSIFSLHTDMTWRRMVYALVSFIILLAFVEKIFNFGYGQYVNLLILFIFFVHSFIVASRQILFRGEVTGNIIIGSLSLYLLLGLIWSIIYLFLLALDPTALSGIEMQSWQHSFSRVTYYSFVTLTTLGYGDILPTNRLAEFFAYMEAIVGVFYMAIIVASLVSIRHPKDI